LKRLRVSPTRKSQLRFDQTRGRLAQEDSKADETRGQTDSKTLKSHASDGDTMAACVTSPVTSRGAYHSDGIHRIFTITDKVSLYADSHRQDAYDLVDDGIGTGTGTGTVWRRSCHTAC